MRNPQKVKDARKVYYALHREEDCKRSKAWRLANLEKASIAQKQWHALHPKKKKEYNKRWKEKDPEKYQQIQCAANKKQRSTAKGQVCNNIARGISRSLNGGKNGKHWEDILGFTFEQLKKHLEKQFTKGMSWENYGRNGWELEHRIPLSAYNFSKPEHTDFKKAWSLKNLQPMWAHDNHVKHNKLTKHFQPSLLI